MKKHNQYGHIGFGLLALLALAVIGAAGYFVWSRQDTQTDDTAYTPPPAQACEGQWLDSHTHQDELGFSQDLANRMRQHKVGCSVIFAHVSLEDPEISMLKLREEFSPNPGRFILFADIVRDDPKAVTRDKLDSFFSQYPNVFIGIGENAFYRPPHQGTSLTAEPWPTIFKFAAEKNIFVMLHLTSSYVDALDTMMSRYPDTKVLLHHNEFKSNLPNLLKKHKNLYYTLDTTNLTSIPEGGDKYDVLLYPPGIGNSGVFLEKYHRLKSQILDRVSTEWLDVFAAAPQRVMWGTDVSLDWHIEDEVYKSLIDFSTEFINRLPEEYRQAYKYDNALKAFGGGVTLQQLSEAEFERLDEAEEN